MRRILLVCTIVAIEVAGCAHIAPPSIVATRDPDQGRLALDQSSSRSGTSRIRHVCKQSLATTKDVGILCAYFISSPFVFVAVMSEHAKAERSGDALP